MAGFLARFAIFSLSTVMVVHLLYGDVRTFIQRTAKQESSEDEDPEWLSDAEGFEEELGELGLKPADLAQAVWVAMQAH